MQTTTRRSDLESRSEMTDRNETQENQIMGMSARQCMMLTGIAAGGAAVGLGLLYYYMRKRRESM